MKDLIGRRKQNERVKILNHALDSLVAVSDLGDGNQVFESAIYYLRNKVRDIEEALEADLRERDEQAIAEGEARYRQSVLADEI